MTTYRSPPAYAKQRVLQPAKLDVLCGRGKPIQDSPGNVRVRVIAEDFVEEYSTARKREKRALLVQMLDVVQYNPEDGTSARFLKRYEENQEYAGWYPVTQEVALEKIAHSLRVVLRKYVKGKLKLKKKPTKRAIQPKETSTDTSGKPPSLDAPASSISMKADQEHKSPRLGGSSRPLSPLTDESPRVTSQGIQDVSRRLPSLLRSDVGIGGSMLAAHMSGALPMHLPADALYMQHNLHATPGLALLRERALMSDLASIQAMEAYLVEKRLEFSCRMREQQLVDMRMDMEYAARMKQCAAARGGSALNALASTSSALPEASKSGREGL